MNYDLAELGENSLEQLKLLWLQVFGNPPSKYTYREFLIQNLAYHKQSLEQSGLNKKTQRRLLQLYESFREDPDFRPPGNKSSFKVGTRLVREWKGTPHTVTVVEKGFEYKGEEFKSLSAIARRITGTRWSGPAFFGLPKDHKR
jgi:hypothetical protein